MLPTQVRDIRGPGTNYGSRHTQRHANISRSVSKTAFNYQFLDGLNQVFGNGLTSFSHVIWKVYNLISPQNGGFALSLKRKQISSDLTTYRAIPLKWIDERRICRQALALTTVLAYTHLRKFQTRQAFIKVANACITGWKFPVTQMRYWSIFCTDKPLHNIKSIIIWVTFDSHLLCQSHCDSKA